MDKIQENDWAIFRDSKGKEWLRQIIKGKSLQTHKGFVIFDEIIGNSYGLIFPILNDKILITRPKPGQITRFMRHGTNIIYEADAVGMISTAGVGPGDQVLEIGTGSGGLTYYLANYCAKNTEFGKVVTIDIRDDHTEIAKKNLERFSLSQKVEFRTGLLPDVLTEKEYFDAAFIDMPTPWLVLADAVPSIKLGSSLMIFLPNWYQVEKTIEGALQLGNLTLLDVFETNRRPMEVNPARHVMRPVFRALVYSGIIIHLMKTHQYEVN